MANELTVAREPDEALIVFTKRGSDGILGLQPGSKITIVSTDEPQRSIVAQVFTPQEIALYTRSRAGADFSDLWSGSWLYRPPVQQFMLVFGDDSVRLDARLTASALAGVVLPIVFAMARMQMLLFGSEPTVKAITQNSPVNISLEGAGSLYEKIATDVIPWRRERAKQIAALDAAQRRAQLEQKRAEVLAAEAATERERAESEAAFARARQAHAEASMKEVELTRARFQLAADMVDHLLPDAPLPEKMQLISQLMPELVKLTSTVELVAVSNDANPAGTGR
ncbi:MAG: hypothetical protein U1D69_12890 [Polynucleobacter sp.]|nr:hypothetical protein [Polynucleobacter sp.]